MKHLLKQLRTIVIIITAMLVQSIAVPVPAQAENEAWDGQATTAVTESNNTYTITTAAELAWVAQQVNKESGNNTFSGKTVKLANDIDLNGKEWTPIGINSTNTFKGIFDGDGYVISNMKVTSAIEGNRGDAYAGLFGYINGNSSHIQNLGVKGEINVTTDKELYAGGIAGKTIDYIDNCYTDITIKSIATGSGQCTIGGIVGNFGSSNSINNCYSIGNVACTGSSNNSYSFGGIVGVGDSQYCYATGAVTGENTGIGSCYVGGIAGVGTISNCIALNRSITGKSDSNTGRIVSDTYGTLASNYASPAIPGDWSNEGADQSDGALLTYADFVSSPSSDTGDAVTFNGWGGSWDFSNKTNLPILKRKTGENTYAAWQSTVAQSTPTRESVMRVYSIADLPQLKAFARTVNNEDNYKNATVELTADITLPAPTSPETSNWTPIGSNTTAGFEGTFDGKGHCISGIKINDNNTNWGGLFDFVNTNGTVMNVGLKEGSITAEFYAGGIAGSNNGTIKNCYTDVTVKAKNSSNAGGIAGTNEGTITNCYSLGDVTSINIAGGIAGEINNGSITYCFATGKIQGKYAGGIVCIRSSNSNINHCLALNTNGVTGTETDGIARIASTVSGASITLANYASPLIRGSWDNKGADTANGADLTKENFTGNDATTNGAFAGWITSDAGNSQCWDFSSNTYLPKLKTTGLTENIAIAGQGNAEGNMPTRKEFLIRTIRISTATDYNAEEHDNAEITIAPTGTLTVDANGVTIPDLYIEEGGQVVVKKEFTCTYLWADRPLTNKWIAYGYSQKMFLTNGQCTLYAMTGYADASNQNWGTPIEQGTDGEITQPANTPTLLAAEEGYSANSVRFWSDGSLTIPADASPKEGASLASGQFLFCVNPTLKNVTLTSPAYLLNADGTRFERTEQATVKPFQAYMVANAITTNSIRSLAIGNDLPTSNRQPALPDGTFRLWAENGMLYLNADTPTKVSLYNATGQLIRRLSLTGQQTVALSPGLYFVRCNNITYKILL